ncbi:MAG: MerR family DNA-binding protein [Candidatus Melainabacteria bacterium]|nr:MerR family DNA-binding protein [Candidatus Melainabacteria bacterium]
MTENQPNYLQIGELSKQTGIAVSALRYYQKVGLLEPCHVSLQTKYRYYQVSDVALAKFIKKSQRLGFSLEEIKQILDERNAGRSPCPKVRVLAKSKIGELDQQIADLQKLEQELNDYILQAGKELESKSDDQRICALIDKADV